MRSKDNLINNISNELRIFRFQDENIENFINRLLFSALGIWIIQSTLDKSYVENYNQIGVSKSYITRKVTKIAEEYVSLFPNFSIYLDNLTTSDFVAKIREEYEKAGYIVPTGFNEFITISNTRKGIVNDEFMILRNNLGETSTKIIGLGSFKVDNNPKDAIDFMELLYIPKVNAKEWTSNYIERLRWGNASPLGESTRYFDMNIKKNFYNCWSSNYPKVNNITIYKTNDWDYGFAKIHNNVVIGIKIPSWLIGQGNNYSERLFDNDVRRFMYGLKALSDNSVKALLIKKVDHYCLRIFNALPSRENTALQLLGWRSIKYIDEFNYIIPRETYEVVKKLLLNLSIDVEEN